LDCTVTVLEACIGPSDDVTVLVEPAAPFENEPNVVCVCPLPFTDAEVVKKPEPDETSVKTSGNSRLERSWHTRSVEYVGLTNSNWLEIHSVIFIHTRSDVGVDGVISNSDKVQTLSGMH